MPEDKKFPIRRILSLVTLLVAVGVLLLAIRKPAPVAARQPAAAVNTNAMSFQAKVDQLAQAKNEGTAGNEVRLTADEITAAIEKANAGGELSSTVAAESGDVSVGQPVITLDGDVVRGQFASEVGGKRVYVTVAGHLGSKDGYATFDPTEFKVGDLNVPVSLVNSTLQKKMQEQRDRLKLPDYIGDLKVENGELVVKQK